MQKSFCFILGLTSACDKKCVLCCNNYDEIYKNVALDFDRLGSKLRDMKTFCTSEPFKNRFNSVYIMLTGGEAFLYQQVDQAGETKNLLDVIGAIQAEIPNVRIVVKTGGFFAHHQKVAQLWDRISRDYPYPAVEFRLGFNLYQKQGQSAEERLIDMTQRMLAHQKMAILDTIYDKNNLQRTAETLEKGLQQLDFCVGQNALISLIRKSPEEHKRINMTNKMHKIFLDVGPAYAPNSASAVYDYFEEAPNPCPTIEEYPNYLYYDTALNLVHCNDSYVDARIPPIRLSANTVLEEWLFMKERFERLKQFLLTTQKQFKTRKERCFFCTKYVMSGD
ncbi:MAG: hypothetical protein A2103_05320 [Gammaproteobacteria bacterium GWF2_41_13]|nr:MAG: hypothetical protein A2103_05320 [Gammaproteobacteria bacterium GWF2_41_13]